MTSKHQIIVHALDPLQSWLVQRPQTNMIVSMVQRAKCCLTAAFGGLDHRTAGNGQAASAAHGWTAAVCHTTPMRLPQVLQASHCTMCHLMEGDAAVLGHVAQGKGDIQAGRSQICSHHSFCCLLHLCIFFITLLPVPLIFICNDEYCEGNR